MEVLKPYPFAPTKTQIFSGISSFSLTPALSNFHKDTRYKFRKTHFKPFSYPLFATNSRLPNCKIPLVTARFGRPSKRRNSLRKKLTHDLQVRQNPPETIDLLPLFVDNGASESNLGSSALEQGSGVMGTQEIVSASIRLDDSDRLGDSVYWSKLDSWVEQYKKDIEVWGIGSNPIFTVFKYASGNVGRVVVDEDEILRRSGVDPLYFRGERELEDFEEVTSKIGYAKFLAREMESGKDVISKNSSVVKFVSKGENLGIVSRIRSVSLPPNLLPKISRVGIAVVCGFLFVWAVKKLFNLEGNKTEVTRFEKEMMRRKIKARMEKEKLQKGSLEVIEEPSEQPIEFIERPPLDKDKLLDTIRKVKGSNVELPMRDGAGAQDVGSANMDAKIQEIQMMARHARNSEREETSSKLPNMEDLAELAVDSVSGDEFEIQASNELPPIGKDSAQEQVDDHMKVVNLNGSFTKPELVNGIEKAEIVGKKEIDGTSFSIEKVIEENDDMEPQTSSSGRIVYDDNSQIYKLADDHDSPQLPVSTDGAISSEVSTSPHGSPKNSHVRRKPKIILSVREAREYLSKKHDQKHEVGDDPSSIFIENEGKSNHTDQLHENTEDPEFPSVNGVLNSDLAANASDLYDMNENGYVPADSNGANKEVCIRLTQNKISKPQTTEGSRMGAKLHKDDAGKIDDMFKNKNACDTSEIFPGGSVLPDTSLTEKEHLRTQDNPGVYKVDELPIPGNLVEVSDHVPDKNDYLDSSNSSEATDLCHDDHDVSLEEKASCQAETSTSKADETDEMLRSSNTSEASVLVADGTDIHDLVPEKNSCPPIGISVDEAFSENDGEDKLLNLETSEDFEGGGGNYELGPVADKENWLERNFHEVEPLMKKIGAGFRSNFMEARDRVNEGMDIGFDFMKDDTELDWMQDDKLRDIVFKVRDNELAGRDPFHSMNPEEKAAFFEGLERKVDIENEKLATLHAWLHSNIENIDYGADGISIYDPPEKVIPRWKGPPIDQIAEFLSNAAGQPEQASSVQKAEDSPTHDNQPISEEASNRKSTPKMKVTKIPRTLIEGSDGSIKPGKKSGKEFWQHTKKWSPGFVEAYNAQSDPEVKVVMKDIGKDLDRWITEKEIQEAAYLMDKLPKRSKGTIEKKLSKVRREMELFGPAAVVSKYREYGEEKEEDYLWWLDLPYVLCIEMYTYEGEEQEIGFYSLEMATDLEIDPKPNHVIAFEDPGDCKNLCYIIQAHLEMLGRGRAFVVAQLPKDAFRQAKANGFGVTVIRKGELQLNIDQPLEEVEELITEIGSKMYHDKLMKEQSVDISALMKGVFGISEPFKRRGRKRALKRPSKP